MSSGKRIQRIMPKLKTLDPGSMHSFVQHLAREQGFLDTVFNTIREAVIVVDSARKILYHNAAAKAMLGIPDDLAHLTIDKLLKGANWDAILPDSGDSPAKLLRQELEISYPQRRIVQVYALPLGDSEDQFAVFLNDITDTMDKAHSDAESERSRLVSMLAAGVAHEIGNPLNSLYLHLQYLQRVVDRAENSGDLDKAGLLEELDESRKEVERLDVIINQFLHALRPGKPDFQPLDLKTLVLESLNFMRHEITAKKVNVEFLWNDDVPLVDGDAGQLKQAFYNLVRNALQSMTSGGSLGIRGYANDEFISLSVSDTGKGICQENLAHIFEAYFTTRRTGTGLGLMIVERIVREHGGSLSVGGREGEGAVFTISLPRRGRCVRVLPPPETKGDAQ